MTSLSNLSETPQPIGSRVSVVVRVGRVPEIVFEKRLTDDQLDVFFAKLAEVFGWACREVDQ